MVIGIISIVLFAIILFQSCAAGIGDVLVGGNSGGAGVFVALCMLIAGIIGIALRNSTVGGWIAGGFYTVGGLIGITNYGFFADLMIWSILSFVFAAVFLIGTILTKDR